MLLLCCWCCATALSRRSSTIVATSQKLTFKVLLANDDDRRSKHPFEFMIFNAVISQPLTRFSQLWILSVIVICLTSKRYNVRLINLLSYVNLWFVHNMKAHESLFEIFMRFVYC